MATLLDVITFALKQQAQTLHTLKTEGVTRESITKYVYLSPEGKSFRVKPPADPAVTAQWKREKKTYEKLVGFLSPQHPRWAEYQRAKRRASLLLTALHLVRLGNGLLPEAKELRQAIREGRLSHHIARTQRVRHVVFQALKLLRKLTHRLERAPERFAAVESWLEQIRQPVKPEAEA